MGSSLSQSTLSQSISVSFRAKDESRNSPVPPGTHRALLGIFARTLLSTLLGHCLEQVELRASSEPFYSFLRPHLEKEEQKSSALAVPTQLIRKFHQTYNGGAKLS
jgi:hypothetical protein